ncbi:MAG: ATP-binding protein [Burkholderiaceae bacterium]
MVPANPHYQQQLSDFRLSYSKAGAITSIVLVLAGVGLDFFSYPDQQLEFFLLRAGVCLLTVGILLLLFTRFGARQVRLLTMVWLLLPQVMIAYMIYRTDGAESIYFVGLHLAMYAVGIILPISIYEGVGFGIMTLAVYLVACLAHPVGIGDGSRLYTNTLFIVFSAIASAVCTWYNERARIRLFALQYEVSQKNDKLVEINNTLAEVKGQLVQREKMAALGTLSAGLLHELNNPVNYSLMAINMGQATPAAAKDEMLKESLNDAREGMERVQHIVSDLKTFAYQKPGADVLRPFLLEKSVQSARRLAGFELKGVAVAIDMPQDSHVVGEEPAIIGVLINLLSNAAHALQRAGREKPEIRVSAAVENGRMMVRVRDNGHGIKPENIDRVFEPFFTTRDVGSGLGLGLSVSYGIIQRHGGTLAVASEADAWTEFSFDLARPEE